MVAVVSGPVIAIVGPTASGKTAVAVRLAEEFNGEIICADSRTVYKGMDIGTAKPTAEERRRVPHWGLDLVSPDERFSVKDFQSYTTDRIADIQSRGKIAFLVGGTGLYIDSIVFDFQFGGDAKEWRESVKENTFVVGIATEKHILLERINTRTEQLFKNGVVEEATILGKSYSWQSPGMTGNAYRVLQPYLEGRLTLDEAKEKFTTLDWQLAKRQMTWLRPNPYIEWCSLDEVYDYCTNLLAPV